VSIFFYNFNYDWFYLRRYQAMSQSRLLSKRVLDESSSDDDDEFIIAAAQIVQSASHIRKKPGGSVPGRTYKYRNREEGHARLYQDYLSENPTYGPTDF
jgi:hypothetical protein